MDNLKRIAEHQSEEDRNMARLYAKMTDEELMEMIRRRTAELGRLPNKLDIPAAFYLKSRFGPWPRLLEKAGVKPVPENRQRKIEARRRKHKKLRHRAGEKKHETKQENRTGRCSG